MSQVLCCHIPCPFLAEYRITTTVDGSVAGPDPYCDTTEACVYHVGELLGWQPELHPDLLDSVYWVVRPIGGPHG